MNKVNQNVTNEKRRNQVFRTARWIEKFAHLNQRKALTRLTILMVLTVILGIQIPNLKFNYDFNSFFPKNDNDLNYYEEINNEFGEFNDFLFIVLKSKTPTNSTFLTLADSTITALEAWAETSAIQSAFDADKIQITPFGINQIKLISPSKKALKQVIVDNNLYGKYFGKDDQSIMLILRHNPFEDNLSSDAFMIKLRYYLGQVYGTDYIISGKVQMQYDFTKKLESELLSLLLIAAAFVVTALALLFRTFKGILIPILALITTVIWTMGFMALTGKSIDVLIVIIPAILLIVALSDVIHFMHKYDEFRHSGEPKQKALKSTIIFIGKATFLTSMTTGIGFLSLYVIPINPIRDFGLYTAIGVFFAFFITYLLLPSVLYFFPKPLVKKKIIQKSNWKTLIDRFFLITLRHRRKVVWIISVICILITLGINQVRLNTSILVGFQKGEPELNEVSYFDENYDGYKPFEIGIRLADNKNIFDPGVLDRIEKIENYVRENYNVRHIESPLTLIKTINAGLYGAAETHYTIPLERDLQRVKRLYNSRKLQELKSAFESSDGRVLRLIGKSKDIGSAEARSLNEKLNEFLVQKINDENVEARLTGTSYLIDKTDNYISTALVKGLGIAVISVSFFLFLFFRDWRIVLYSLIPNLLPILILFGLMGYFQVDLNISTAVIFTVAFGVAVDDSIHLLASYYLERQQTHKTLWAVKSSLSGAGKSIIITSLVLCSGFALFLTSGLSSPYYLGLFIVITSVVALILDLTLLPLLILGIEKKTRDCQD